MDAPADGGWIGPRNQVSDLRGVSRLAVEATAGLTGVIEAMHADIARVPAKLGGPLVDGAVHGIARIAYRSVQGVTRLVGGGVDLVLGRLVPALGHVDSSARREGVVAAVNGVVGDHLAATGNPLAIAMRLRRDGKPLELTRKGLAAAVPSPGPRIVVLVHGLCMNDLQWARQDHDHGAALARDLGHVPLYLHYNTGRHVSTNGRALSAILEALVAAWPVPVEELAIVAHSMGGLVARSAHHYGTRAGHAWRHRLRKLVFLGTPHHGAALERGGHRLHRLFDGMPWVAPLARLGEIRSAGITDLRHGSLLDEDWQDRDRFAHAEDVRRPVPLPDGVDCFAVGATMGRSVSELRGRLLGDGLVPLPSALGRHRDPRFRLAFPEAHQWVAYETGHFELLGRPEVYERVRVWLAR